MNKKPVLDFVSAINAHDVDGILSMMTEDHLFIDTYGHKENKEAMKQGWAGYFEWFPDYLIEVTDMLESGDTVGVFGYASGTFHGQPGKNKENYWRLPAAWKVVVVGDKVKIWQVYADSKIPYDIMDAWKQAAGVK